MRDLVLGQQLNHLRAFCAAEALDFDALLKCPKCYDDTMLAFLYVPEEDEEPGGGVVMGGPPAKVLLTVTQAGDGSLIFHPAEDVHQFI